jgi:catalase (peroxidase I)
MRLAKNLEAPFPQKRMGARANQVFTGFFIFLTPSTGGVISFLQKKHVASEAIMARKELYKKAKRFTVEAE